MLLLSHFSRVWLCVTATASLGFFWQEHWSGLPFPSPVHKSEKWKWSLSVMSDSSRPHGLQPTRLLHPWDFPGKSTRVGCHCLLQFGDRELNKLDQFSSVQFSLSVMSDSLRPRESQHARPPCPSPTPRVYSNPCPSSQWCHPAISSSVVPFSSCPQYFPALGSFPMSQLFASGGQIIVVSAATSVLLMNTQDWSLGWTGWIFLQPKALSRVFSNTTVQKQTR